MPIKMTDKDTIQKIIFKHVEEDTTIYTDEHGSYDGLDEEGYEHDTVNHSEGEYVDGPVHTNSIEAVWAVFKRGLKASTTTSRSSTLADTLTSTPSG